MSYYIIILYFIYEKDCHILFVKESCCIFYSVKDNYTHDYYKEKIILYFSPYKTYTNIH